MSVTALRAEAPETVEKTDEPNIALLMEADPSIVIREPEKLASLYKRIDADIAAQAPDLTTEKGRKAIASLAFKITRTKTAVEAAAKKMTEDFRKATAEVNATRNAIVESLEAKQKQARKPLTDWETAEEARITRVRDDIAAFRANAAIPMGMTAAELVERIEDLRLQDIDPEVFQDRHDEAVAVKAASLATMYETHVRLLQEEADKAELDRLREAQAKRDAEDAARAESERLAAKARADAEAEQARIAAAAEQARQDAIEQERLKHQAELDRIKKERDDTEKARQAEADRIAREQADKAAEEKRKADEDAKRAANVAHRTKIKTAAKKAIIGIGADEDLAIKIIQAIVAGEVPAVVMQF
ncbi:hypothetical protein ACN6KF_001504 [Labrys sp. La1]|uniref:hypothetical protein n=1 Tax=Labrys sp. La1 TaxID=3404917 RepID=UPI003EB7A172